MSIHLGSIAVTAADAVDSPSLPPIPEEEEFYSSWTLFLVCLLLILSLWTSYYLQIKRIRAIHETVVSIVAGMAVGLVVRLAPGHLIREMLVSHRQFFEEWGLFLVSANGADRMRRRKEGDEGVGLPTMSRSYQCCNRDSATVTDHSTLDFQAHALLQPPPSSHHSELWL
jgi:hypothetical protein